MLFRLASFHSSRDVPVRLRHATSYAEWARVVDCGHRRTRARMQKPEKIHDLWPSPLLPKPSSDPAGASSRSRSLVSSTPVFTHSPQILTQRPADLRFSNTVPAPPRFDGPVVSSEESRAPWPRLHLTVDPLIEALQLAPASCPALPRLDLRCLDRRPGTHPPLGESGQGLR